MASMADEKFKTAIGIMTPREWIQKLPGPLLEAVMEDERNRLQSLHHCVMRSFPEMSRREAMQLAKWVDEQAVPLRREFVARFIDQNYFLEHLSGKTGQMLRVVEAVFQ